MKKLSAFTMRRYAEETVGEIIEKYDFKPMDAARAFLTSKTHAMIEDPEAAMWEFDTPAIFEMWEVERVTGDPRNSIYIRGE